MIRSEACPVYSRRAIARGLAVGLATTTTARPWSSALLAQPTEPSSAPLRAIDGVQLAIATICTDGFGNQHHQPAFESIPAMGFANVEFNLWYADQMTGAYIRSIAERCAKTQLKPISVQSTSFGSAGGRAGIIKDVSHKLLMIEAARTLGCRVVKFTGSKRGTAGGLEAIIQVCKEIAPAAEEMGVLVTLENHTGNNLETIEDYDKIFNAIASPSIGMCLDTGHFEGSGIRLSEVVDRFHSRTLHVDLKDCREFGSGHDTVVFGKGITDFDTFLNHLVSKNYRGYLVIEQAWNEPKGDWRLDLKQAHGRFARWESGSKNHGS